MRSSDSPASPERTVHWSAPKGLRLQHLPTRAPVRPLGNRHESTLSTEKLSSAPRLPQVLPSPPPKSPAEPAGLVPLRRLAKRPEIGRRFGDGDSSADGGDDLFQLGGHECDKNIPKTLLFDFVCRFDRSGPFSNATRPRCCELDRQPPRASPFGGVHSLI